VANLIIASWLIIQYWHNSYQLLDEVHQKLIA